eukprot:Rmarinus@m.19247
MSIVGTELRTENESRSGSASRDPPKKLIATWHCLVCDKPCMTAGPGSRCMCDHYLKDHRKNAVKSVYVCGVSKCACRHFQYHVQQGSFQLRCRCKHRHRDHDPTEGRYNCTKRKCDCTAFDSPFVCNCSHGWVEHETRHFYQRVSVLHRMTPPGYAQTAHFRMSRETCPMSTATALYQPPPPLLRFFLWIPLHDLMCTTTASVKPTIVRRILVT